MSTTRARVHGGARVILERPQQVLQPQVADVVVVEVERGQRLVLHERRAQELGALIDTAVALGWACSGRGAYFFQPTTYYVLRTAQSLLRTYCSLRRTSWRIWLSLSHRLLHRQRSSLSRSAMICKAPEQVVGREQ